MILADIICRSASVVLSPGRQQRLDYPEDMKYVHIDPLWSRLLTVVLLTTALLGCILLVQLRRPSGLTGDVKGIAGVAAMANKSHIIMDFRNLDIATPDEVHATLRNNRYVLKHSSLSSEKYETSSYKPDRGGISRSWPNPHPLMLRLHIGVLFIIGIFLFTCLLPIVLFTSAATVVTDRASWLLTGIAVTIKLVWGTLETDVRMMEPFYILSKRNAPPEVLTLDYTGMAFGWLPIQALLNGHILMFLVGFGSVLAELLTVCVTSFNGVTGTDFVVRDTTTTSPTNRTGLGSLHITVQMGNSTHDSGNARDAGEETFLSFWVSFGLSLGILTYLCVVAVVVYARRRHLFLPRQPNTIASVLAYIHQSKMLWDFVNADQLDNDEISDKVAHFKKTYGLGWFYGRDEIMHCGVDEEPLRSSYTHGIDDRMSVTQVVGDQGPM